MLVFKKDSPFPPRYSPCTSMKNNLDEIDGDSPCLFDTVVAVLLYVDNVVLLFKPWACLQRILNKIHEFHTSPSLEVNIFRTQIMIFGRNKMKLHQEAFYLDKDQIGIAHIYTYLDIHFYSHGYFEPSSKWRRMIGMEALMDILSKETIVAVTCWELKSHFFKAPMLSTFTDGVGIWGGNLNNSHWKAFEKGMKMHMMSHI